jgi:ketosteroid isomerase-like protein
MLRDKVKQAYLAFARGDMDAFFEQLSFHADAIMVEPEGLSDGGTYRGPVAIRKGIEAAIAAWEDRVEFEDFAASENLVYVYMHAFCKSQKTGMSYAFPVVEVLRFQGDQCIEFKPFYDTARAKAVADT